MDSKPKKDAQLNLRVKSSTKRRLREAARRRDRSTNWLAEDILERWLNKHEPRPSK